MSNLSILLLPQATSMLTFLLFFCCLVRWIRSTFNNTKRTPPQPSGSWPLLGHLPLLGTLPHINMGKLADQYGPLIMIKLGVNQVLVASTGKMAKEFLGSNDKVFATRPYLMAAELLGYNSTMMGWAPYGQYWLQTRKITSAELLSNHQISLFKAIRISEVRSVIKVIYDQTKTMRTSATGSEVCEKPIDMTKLFHDLGTDSVVRSIFGKSLKEFYQGEEYNQCAKAIRTFSELAGTFVPSDALPFVKWLDIGGYEKKMKEIAKVIDNMAQRWLDEHKNRRGSVEKSQRQDFMDILLDTFEAGQFDFTNYDIDAIIKANCMSLILAGSDTTAVVLIWALSLLLNNKDVLEKTQAEVDAVVGKERQVEESDLKNLFYLQAVFKETLRLYPPAPLAIPHKAITDCTVAGYKIKAGTQLILNLYKIHRDPHVWEDPLVFDPERFLTTHKDYDVRGQNYEYIPFGSGRRMCPGISYALQVIPLTLATLLHGFNITIPSNESSVDMTESFGLTNTKATPLKVIFTQRLPDHLYTMAS